MKSAILLFTTLCLFVSCRTVSISNEIGLPTLPPEIKKYKTIHVGWLDLTEKDWGKYRYENQNQWKKVINDLNINSVQPFIKYHLPKKTFTYTKSKDDPMPKGDGLLILFSNIEIIDYGQYLSLDVDFIDIAMSKRVYNLSLYVYQRAFIAGPWLTNHHYRKYTFEGRLVNLIDNYTNYIAGLLMDD